MSGTNVVAHKAVDLRDRPSACYADDRDTAALEHIDQTALDDIPRENDQEPVHAHRKHAVRIRPALFRIAVGIADEYCVTFLVRRFFGRLYDRGEKRIGD